jgi:peroxiredoxin (alkyl hydroperoxide reductase subunit C)
LVGCTESPGGRGKRWKEVAVPEMKDGCVKPVRGPLPPPSTSAAPAGGAVPGQEVTKMTARVGVEATDFEANAFVQGFGFKPVKLSDHKGKWIVLCFYPGDFTFV